MRLSSLAALAWCACAPGPTGSIAPPAPTRVAYGPPPETAETAETAAPICIAEQGSAPVSDAAYGLDFTEPIRLVPATWGARPTDQPPAEGAPRTREDLFEALHRQQRPMLACHRRAQGGRPPEARRVVADFVVDPFGRIVEASASGGGEELERCVTEILRSMRVDVRTPRQTHATLKLRFAPLDAVTPPAPRPAEVVPYLPALCLQHPPGPLPTDELVEIEHDFITFGAPRPEEAPRHILACPPSAPRIMPAVVLRALQAHRGAFNECVAETPETATVTARFEVVPSGSLRNVTLDGAEPPLSACLQRALETVRVPHVPVHGPFVAKASFAIASTIPTWPEEPRARGEAMLEMGHGAGALEAFAEVVRRNAPGDACWGRLGVLRAQLTRAPWIDDPRVWSALDDLVDHHPHLPRDAPTQACLQAAAPVLTEVALWPFVIADHGPWTHLGRFHSTHPGHAMIDQTVTRARALLARAPHLPGAPTLHELLTSDHASQRWSTARGQAWLSPTCPPR